MPHHVYIVSVCVCGLQTEALIGYGDWVCRTVHDKSKMSKPWYQYAISQMNAVSSAIDAISKHLGQQLLPAYLCIEAQHVSK